MIIILQSIVAAKRQTISGVHAKLWMVYKFYFRFMKKLLSTGLLFFLLLPNSHAQRTQALFDSSWKFYRGDVSDGERKDLNDKDWRAIELPHDWSIEDLPGQSDSTIGPFTTRSIG